MSAHTAPGDQHGSKGDTIPPDVADNLSPSHTYLSDTQITPTNQVQQVTPKERVSDAIQQSSHQLNNTNVTTPDYFTSDLAHDWKVARKLDDDQISELELLTRQISLPPLVVPQSVGASTSTGHVSNAPGNTSNAVATTNISPNHTSPAQRLTQSQRASPSHEPSTVMLNDDQAATTQSHSYDLSSSSGTPAAPKPSHPNQSYAALLHQHHPVRAAGPTLRTRSSNSNQSLSLSGVAPFHQHQSGSRTVGNSPAVTPSAGLYSPRAGPRREEWDSPETPGTYASPYLHPTHRQAPKETHIADVDIDPISGRKLINHYEIIDELGRGTHGKVKLGKDLDNSDSYVAIKIVERYSKKRRLGKLGNPEDKVKKEVAILKKARHPNVVALLEVIDDPSRKKVYIVLEWVERGTIHWRAKAPREVALLEAHRYERERSGHHTSDLASKDNALQKDVESRLTQRKREINGDHRTASQEHDPDRRIDNVSGHDLESHGNKISTLASQSVMASNVQSTDDGTIAGTTANEDTRVDQADHTPREGLNTPLAREASLEMSPANLNDALRHQTEHTSPNHDSGTATPFEPSEHSRNWAAELLDGELNPELEYVPCMTMQNIRVAFRDTLLGIQYLHYQGIVHRDIKPPNLLQTIDHRVKISDFGVSYLGRPVHEGEPGEGVSESEATDLDTEAKELAKTVGTPAFYAPELCITDHLDDHPPVTKAIDVWALGITLFCMLFARTPFVDTEYVVMRQIADEEIYIPRRRLKPVEDEPKSRSRSSSRSHTYSPARSERRSELNLEYEEIDDDLHDLLKRLLTKDPRQRIVLEAVSHHPWVVADLPNKVQWLEETDSNQQSQGKKIEVSKEDVNTAVVPLLLERMRSGIRKIGDRLMGSSNRGRSTSSAATSGSALASQPPSAHSSSSTISQDARRQSLRGDEIFSALRASREADHTIPRNLSANLEHEKSNHDFFDEMPPTPGPYQDFGASLSSTVSYDSTTRPSLPGRSKTGISTTGSIRTIKQSDYQDQANAPSPPLSPGLPGTPRAIEGSTAANLSALLGGSGRNFIKTIRESSATGSSRGRTRALSIDRVSITSSDAYAEPTLAVSETSVAGHVQAPELRPVKTPASSASNSAQHSPVSTRPHSMMLPANYRSSLSLSRQSSASSLKSSGPRLQNHDVVPARPQPRTSATVSSAEEWHRAEEERIRRALQEMQAPKQTPAAFDQRDCPPSPDDQRGRSRRTSEFNIAPPDSSYDASPITRSRHMQSSSIVSSSSDIGSAVSTSISNPSIPSVITEATSIDAADGLSLEELSARQHHGSHGKLLATHNTLHDIVDDEGYNPDADMALDSDNYDSDADTDSDGGLTMVSRKSNPRSLLSSSPRLSTFSAALEASGRKERRGTNLSRSSKKSSRSGSNNTMKKVRTRDSIDDQRRPSLES